MTLTVMHAIIHVEWNHTNFVLQNLQFPLVHHQDSNRENEGEKNLSNSTTWIYNMKPN